MIEIYAQLFADEEEDDVDEADFCDKRLKEDGFGAKGREEQKKGEVGDD